MNYEAILGALRESRYEAHFIKTKVEAAACLNEIIDGTEIGFGDSATIAGIGLYVSLATP